MATSAIAVKHTAIGLRLIIGAAFLMLLTGCASTLSAKVTTFQQWPNDAQGATYKVVPPAGEELETQAFSDMIRAAIGRTGLVEAQGQQAARFNVHFEYGVSSSQEWEQRYHDPYFNGFWPWGMGGYYGGYRGWGGGIYYTPSVVNVPVRVERNTLTVTINDNSRNGAQVYKSTAVSTSGNLVEVMPYLARAVFDGFPGNNGQVRNITYDLNQ